MIIFPYKSAIEVRELFICEVPLLATDPYFRGNRDLRPWTRVSVRPQTGRSSFRQRVDGVGCLSGARFRGCRAAKDNVLD